jgi:hypothetical protein
VIHRDDDLLWNEIPTEPDDPAPPGVDTVLFWRGDPILLRGVATHVRDGTDGAAVPRDRVMMDGEVEIVEPDGSSSSWGPGDVLITPKGSKAK